ncbi:MAG: S41 family peptidase [Thermoguttaceae bacterium]|nr:S41 family peptidase [Thermoguttaceae bacterium]
MFESDWRFLFMKKVFRLFLTGVIAIAASCATGSSLWAQDTAGNQLNIPASSRVSSWTPTAVPAPLVTSESKDTRSDSALSVPVTPLNRVHTRELPLPATIGIDAQIAPIAKPTDSPTSSIDLELRKTKNEGEKLLAEKKWNEARTFFEKANRKYSSCADIHNLFTISRCRLEISNRYHDESFDVLLKSLSRDTALALHDEVFNNILRYHVDTPHFNELFQLGLDSLALAVTDEDFLAYYAVSPENATNLVNYCALLKNESQKWNIDTYKIFRECIAGIADLIEKGVNIPAAATIVEFTCGITVSLDPYSTFLTRGQMNDIYSMIDGHFVGLGVELRSDEDSLLISRVIPNSPADRSGLKRGERIVNIDGVPTGSRDQADQSGNLLQGPEGTSVLLKIRSVNGSVSRDVRVVRQRVDVPSVENVHIMNPDSQTNRVGYARVSCFQKTTVTELLAALRYLDSLKMNCFIIDLRQNPGGLLQEAIEATNLFVEKGTIVRTRGRQVEKPYYARPEGTWAVPLVILIDGNSASASEIFAGAIRDNHRGLIVGTRSFGKGTVQAIIQLNGTSNGAPIAGLRLTTEKFYSPNGSPYSGIGVEPDVLADESSQTPQVGQEKTVFQNVSATKAPQDTCLSKAFEEAQRIMLSDRNTATRSF